MERRGRPTEGVGHVDKLEGEEAEKQRLRLILQTLNGELSVKEAAEALGLSESRVHELRDQALQGALDALTPKAAGRPMQVETPEQKENRELKAQLLEAQKELLAERVRTEVALAFPEQVYTPEMQKADAAAAAAAASAKKKSKRRQQKRQRHERRRQRRLVKRK
jgi:transposase